MLVRASKGENDVNRPNEWNVNDTFAKRNKNCALKLV